MPASDYVLSLREKIGNDWIMLPGSSAMIFNDEGHILLHQRTDNGAWSLIGGGADPGEHPAETAVREAYEEVGVQVVPERIVGVYGGADHLVTYPNGDKIAYTITAFKCRIVTGEPHVADDESLDVRFFPTDALPESLIQRHRIRIEHVLTRNAPYFDVPAQMPPPNNANYMKTLRTVTGKAQIMLLGATAVIRDEQGRVLVQQRVDSGMWNLPGGCMEVGEYPATTAMREAFEETGLEVQPTRLVGVYGGEDYFVTYPNGDEVAYINYTFECRITGGRLSAANSESAALRFVTPDTLPQPFDSNHVELIEHTFNRSTPYFKMPR
jgi:8-oxo-dGTP pyrophosphatase MutT (NUDIX family)